MQRAANAASKDQPCRVKLRIWRFHPPPPVPADGGNPCPDIASSSPGGASGSGAPGSRDLGLGEQAGAHARQQAAPAARRAGSDPNPGSNPGAAPAPKRFRQLEGATALLTIQDAVLCSEMGVHFSPCGRYLAACVACRVRALAHPGNSWFMGRHNDSGPPLVIASQGVAQELGYTQEVEEKVGVWYNKSKGFSMTCHCASATGCWQIPCFQYFSPEDLHDFISIIVLKCGLQILPLLFIRW